MSYYSLLTNKSYELTASKEQLYQTATQAKECSCKISEYIEAIGTIVKNSEQYWDTTGAKLERERFFSEQIQKSETLKFVGNLTQRLEAVAEHMDCGFEQTAGTVLPQDIFD